MVDVLENTQLFLGPSHERVHRHDVGGGHRIAQCPVVRLHRLGAGFEHDVSIGHEVVDEFLHFSFLGSRQSGFLLLHFG